MMPDFKARWDFTHRLRRLETITDFGTWPRSDPASKRNGTSEPRCSRNTGAGPTSQTDLTPRLQRLALSWLLLALDLSTIIAVPVAVGLQAGAIVCGLLGAGGKFIGRWLGVKARKYDQIRVLAVSKLNSIADRISAALTDDKISEEEFRMVLSEVDKYNQMKAEIRGRQKDGGGLSENEKKAAYEPHERQGDANGPYQALGRAQSCWKQWHLSINISCSRA